MVWDFSAKLINQSIFFLVSIVLTRILEPEDYGVFGLLLVIISLIKVFAESGMGAGLIQTKSASTVALSTVFWLNVFLSLFIYLIVYMSADLFQAFYNYEDLKLLIRVASLDILLSSLGFIQRIKLVKELNFRVLSVINVVSTLISAIVAIYLVLNDFNIWSLIFQQLTFTFVQSSMLLLNSKWYPRFELSLNSVSGILNFGIKKLATDLLSVVFTRLDILIFAKSFSASAVGFYSKAQSFAGQLESLSSTSILSVFFPVISKYQGNKPRLIDLYLNSYRSILLITLSLSGVLYISAEFLIVQLFTAKWSASIILFKLIVINSYLKPTGALMVNLMLGMGYAGLNLKLEIIKKILRTLPLAVAVFGGMKMFLLAMIFHGIIAQTINMYMVNKIIQVKILQQWHSFIVTAIPAIVSGFACYFTIGRIDSIMEFVLCTIQYFIAFILISYMTNKNALIFTFSKMKSIFKK